MKGILRFRGLPALVALLLAVAGALGWGLGSSRSGGTIVVADRSPSCDPGVIPEGARTSDDSDLGAALFAAAADPEAARLLLVTDGCDVTGRAPALPPLPVDVWLRPRRDDVGILELRTPERITAGEDFSVAVTVGRTAGDAPPVEVTVQLLRDGERVGAPSLRIRVARGERATRRFRDRVPRDGLVVYEAVLTAPAGDATANNRLATVARIGEEPLVLVVGDGPAPPGVVAVRRPASEVAAFLRRRGAAAALDAILLDAPRLAEDAQEEIVAAVRSGTGLLATGAGDYAGAPLEAILPLTDRPPGGRALLLLLDFSGSMAPRLEELARAVDALRGLLHADDRVAFLAFRDVVRERAPWTRAGAARWDLRSLVARGNTRLAPALREAAALVAEAGALRRRVFVVSDGAWADRESADLAAALAALRATGSHVAALFVEGEVPPHSRALFPQARFAGDDLSDALEAAERAAPDRVVPAPVAAQAIAGPVWLDGGALGSGDYPAVPRLYPRGVGERVVLAAGEVPVAATLEPGGRVLQTALSATQLGARAGALARAVARPTTSVRLRAKRIGAGVHLEAEGSGGVPFVVEGKALPARPVGPGRWSAVLEEAGGESLLVECAGARLLVAPAVRRELEGLTNRPDIAAAIALGTGGRLLDAAPEPSAGTTPAVYWTLLLAAVVVLAGAILRSRM